MGKRSLKQMGTDSYGRRRWWWSWSGLEGWSWSGGKPSCCGLFIHAKAPEVVVVEGWMSCWDRAWNRDREKRVCVTGWGVEEEMDEDDEKQMEGGLFSFLFFLCRETICVWRRLSSPGALWVAWRSFLWLQIDHGGLVAVMQLLSAVVREAFRSSSKSTKTWIICSILLLNLGVGLSRVTR